LIDQGQDNINCRVLALEKLKLRVLITDIQLKRRQIYPLYLIIKLGHAVAQLIEALCYKPQGRGFDSQ
jgi:hypothetical protein